MSQGPALVRVQGTAGAGAVTAVMTDPDTLHQPCLKMNYHLLKITPKKVRKKIIIIIIIIIIIMK